MISNPHRIFALLLVMLMSSTVIADTIDVGAPISDVTLYRDGGAIITRRGTFTLPAGNHTVKIGGITRDLDPGFGLKARFTRNSASISQVRIAEKFSDAVLSDAQTSLVARIETLEAENLQDHASIEAINLQLRFIEKLGSSAGDKSLGATSNPDAVFETLQKSLEFVQANSTRMISERRALQTAINTRNDRIEALQMQLDQTGAARKSENIATLSVSAAGTATVNLELSYMVNNAGWSVETEANLASNDSAASVKLYALVSQQSGEDWSDVPLILSTTRPGRDIHNIKPQPVYFNLDDPESPSRLKAVLERAREDRMMVEEAGILASPLVRFEQTGFDAAFVLDEPVTIPADGSQERFLVAATETTANVLLRATPSMGPRAYVYADTRLTGFPHLMAPEVSLIRDGSYVGAGRWPDLKPDTDLKLPFGVSDRVRVETIILPAEDGDSGLFNKRMNRNDKKLFRITNNHNEALTIEVFDRLPNSMNEYLKIEWLRGSTEPTESDIDGQPGVLMWRKTVPAGEVWEINHWYKYSYPEDKRLVVQ